MSVEIWKDIPEYEGLYQVSNLGRVKSLKVRKEKILKPFSNPKGYLRACLSRDKEQRCFFVHRIVMLAFKGDSPLSVDHLNEIKSDNRLCNLEYVTIRENVTRATVSRGGASSRHVGVKWSDNARKWIATITYKGKAIHLGCFSEEKCAAKSYKDALGRIAQGKAPIAGGE